MILLLICFVSLLFVSFRMVSLPIDFVLHPKIPVSLRSETSETGGQFCYLRKKVSLCFASVSLRSKIWGHPTSGAELPQWRGLESWLGQKLEWRLRPTVLQTGDPDVIRVSQFRCKTSFASEQNLAKQKQFCFVSLQFRENTHKKFRFISLLFAS